jgi:hypothetical protein
VRSALIAGRTWRLAATAGLWRAVAFLGRTVEATQLLPQGFNLAFIGGRLSLRFLEQFQHLIELIERVAQRGDDGHDLVNRIVDGRRVRRLGRRWRAMRTAFFAMARWLWSGRFTRGFSGLVGNLHLR